MGGADGWGPRRHEAGETVEVWITDLELAGRPDRPPPPAPVGPALALIGARNPPPAWFLYLYREVGGPWEWTDWFHRSPEALAAFVGHPEVRLTTLLVDGWPGGFFMLDTRESEAPGPGQGACDLAYFGLVPQAVGRGLGRWLLSTAVHMAFDLPGVRRVTVNTCTLDHPRALALYQRVGFRVAGRRRSERVLSGPWPR